MHFEPLALNENASAEERITHITGQKLLLSFQEILAQTSFKSDKMGVYRETEPLHQHTALWTEKPLSWKHKLLLFEL